MSAATVSGITWEAGQFCGAGWQGRATFNWKVNPNFKLPEGYAYEIVIWTPEKGQNPMTVQGRVGAVRGTSTPVNPAGFQNDFNFDLLHQIAVALVVNVPGAGYERVKIMGPDNCMFRFTGGGSGGGGGSDSGSATGGQDSRG
jgi:hypothetical protein